MASLQKVHTKIAYPTPHTVQQFGLVKTNLKSNNNYLGTSTQYYLMPIVNQSRLGWHTNPHPAQGAWHEPGDTEETRRQRGSYDSSWGLPRVIQQTCSVKTKSKTPGTICAAEESQVRFMTERKKCAVVLHGRRNPLMDHIQ